MSGLITTIRIKVNYKRSQLLTLKGRQVPPLVARLQDLKGGRARLRRHPLRHQPAHEARPLRQERQRPLQHVHPADSERESRHELLHPPLGQLGKFLQSAQDTPYQEHGSDVDSGEQGGRMPGLWRL